MMACPKGGLEGCCCAKPFPKEFRDDVVNVARRREPGVTLEQIATDFGVHPITLSKWLRVADVEDGVKPGPTSDQLAELRELKRRNRLLEQENEVLRRAAAYLSQANLPGKGSTRS
jgi:transposase